VFIDEWFGAAFYQKLPLDYRSKHRFGQIFWTHVYYPHENLQLWRPVNIHSDEPTRTTASHFRIVPAGADSFKRGYPLHDPPIRSREEFIVIKAKRRPVILVQSEPPIHGGENRNYKARFSRPLCLVAQCFGIVDKETGRTKFDPKLIDRIRAMEFPQIVFLPQQPACLESDGLLRLDQLQSVFVPHLEPTQYCLGDEVVDLVKEQLRYLLTGDQTPSNYTELRETLLKDYADGEAAQSATSAD
jgi:hypothetical protein